MKVSGVTFIRNAILYDYPVVESIQSILPLCDEVVVAVGNSEDDTLSLIQSIDPHKIKIIETIWDDSLREGGRVLAEETDKAFKAIDPDADWAIYIQGDEVFHEQDYNTIRQAMEKHLHNKKIQGLLFNYWHFYGSYDYVGSADSWYPHEIRIIRNDKSIYSYRDAQGFRMGNNKKLKVAPIQAWVYHYGWVKDPKAMQRKQESFNRYWHDDEWVEKNISKEEAFDYEKHVRELIKFTGEHPKVIQKRIKATNWKFDYDPTFSKRSLKHSAKNFLKKYLGLDFSYKNYRL